MATREITTKFKIEGIDEFKSGVSSANSALALHKSELAKVEAQYSGQQNTVEALTAKQSALSSMYDAQRQKTQALESMVRSAQSAQEKYSSAVDQQKSKIAATAAELERLKSSTGDTTEEERRLSEELTKQQKELNSLETCQQKAERAVTDYQKQANNAEAALIKLNNEIDENDRYLSEAASSADGCAASIDGYGRKVAEAGDKAESFGTRASAAVDALASSLAANTLKQSFEEIKAALMECVSAATDFETAMAKVATLAGTDAVPEMSAQLLEASSELGQSATELSEAAYQAISAGVDAGDSVSFAAQATKLAVGGFTDAATAVDVLTTALNAYGLSSAEAERIGDMLVTTQNLGKTTVNELASAVGKVIPVAAAYGVEMDNLSAAYAVLTANGIATAEATTYLKSMLNELGDSGSTVSSVLKEQTGQSFSDLTASGYSLGDVLEVLGSYVDGDSAAFNELWSSSEAGVGALSILGSGAEKYNSVLLAMQDSAGATNSAFETMADTTEYSQRRMSVAFENLKTAVGSELTPVLNEAAEMGSGLIQWATDFIEAHPGVVQAITAVTAALGVFVAGVTLAKTAMLAFQLVANTNPFVLIATAAAAAAAAIATFVAHVRDSSSQVDELTASATALQSAVGEADDELSQSTVEVKAAAETAKGYISRLKELESSVGSSAAAQMEYAAVVEALNTLIPDLNLSLDEETGLVEGGTDAIEANTAAWEENALMQARQDALSEVFKKEADAELELALNRQKLQEATDTLAEAQTRHDEITAEQAELQEELNEIYTQHIDQFESYSGCIERINTRYAELDSELASTTETIGDTQLNIDYLNTAIEEDEAAIESAKEDVALYTAALAEAAEAEEDAADSADGYSGSLESCKTAVNGMCEELKALMDEYGAAYDEAYSSIDGQMGLFDEMSVSVETSVGDMLNALESQVEYMTSYAENLKRAAELGLDEGLLAELSDGSEESAAYLQAIVEDGGQKIQELNEKFAEVQTGKDTFATAVAELETDFDTRMQAIVDGAAEDLTELDMAEDAYNIGAENIQAYIGGLDSQSGALYRKMTQIANSSLASFKKALDIRSPSHKLEETGRYTIQGYVLGLEDEERGLEDALALISDLVKEAFPDSEDAEELAKSFADAYTDALGEARDAVSEIEDEIAGMEETLAGYGDFTKTVSISWSDGSSSSWTELADINEQTARLEQYGQMLDSLTERGINPSLMQEILSMGVDDALTYGGMLLELESNDWESYMEAYSEKLAKSAEIAQKYYEEDLQDAQDFVSELENGLTDDAEETGENVVLGIIEGLKAQENALYAKARAIAETVAATINDALDIHSPSGVGADIGSYFVQGIGAGVEDESEKLRSITAASVPAALTEPADNLGAAMQNQTAAMVNAFSTLTSGMASGGDLTVIMKSDSVEYYRATIQNFRRVSAETPEIEVDAL